MRKLVTVAAIVVGCGPRPRSIDHMEPGRAFGVDDSVDTGIKPIGTCAIRTVAFPTLRDGWVADVCGHVFRTTDSGRSFVALRPADGPLARAELPQEHVAPRPWVAGVTHMTWTSRTHGLAFLWDESFETHDAGATWVRLERAPHAILATSRRGAELWACTTHGVSKSADDGRSWTVMPRPFERLCRGIARVGDRIQVEDHDGHRKQWAAGGWIDAPRGDDRLGNVVAWGRGSVRFDGGLLTFLRGDRVVARSPLRSAGGGLHELVRGVTPVDAASGRSFAWTDHDVLESWDQGARFVTVEHFEWRIHQVIVDDHSVQTVGYGHSSDRWVPRARPHLLELDVTGALSTRDPARAREVNPLRCLASSKHATLEASAHGSGGYGWWKTWSFARALGSVTLTFRYKPAKITEPQFGKLVDAMAAAVERPLEGQPGYHVSSLSLDWRCDDGEPRSARFPGLDYGGRAELIHDALRALHDRD